MPAGTGLRGHFLHLGQVDPGPEPGPAPLPAASAAPAPAEHENLRGAGYYADTNTEKEA